jgi:hypothetical protein
MQAGRRNEWSLRKHAATVRDMAIGGTPANGRGLQLRDFLLPWRLARVIYGPYGASELAAKLRQGEFGVEAPVQLADELAVRIGLDPLLRVLVPVRAWVGLGVVVLAVKVLSEPDPLDRAWDAMLHGAITMVLGPYGVLLGIAALLVVVRRQRRLLVRPALIAGVTVLVSVGVFGLQLPGIRQYVERFLAGPREVAGSAAWGLLGLVGAPWLFVFGFCAVYLMHRNGFSTHSHPYLRPIVSAWLAAAVAAVELATAGRAGVPDTGFVAATLAGPVAAIGLGVVEVLRLNRLRAQEHSAE